MFSIDMQGFAVPESTERHRSADNASGIAPPDDKEMIDRRTAQATPEYVVRAGRGAARPAAGQPSTLLEPPDCHS
jgi:hypothetical protein